jgi:hypothetical protein
MNEPYRTFHISGGAEPLPETLLGRISDWCATGSIDYRRADRSVPGSAPRKEALIDPERTVPGPIRSARNIASLPLSSQQPWRLTERELTEYSGVIGYPIRRHAQRKDGNLACDERQRLKWRFADKDDVDSFV